MKSFPTLIRKLAIMMFAFGFFITAQAIDLKIATNGPGQIRFEWDAVSGQTYELKSVSSLDSFDIWQTVSGPVVASSNSITFNTALPAASNGFYRVFPANAEYPLAAIRTPSSNEVLSGTINIRMFAIDDSRISMVTLFVDEIPYVTLTEGLLDVPLNTALYSNGVHTLRAVVQDNVGIVPLGGDSGSEIASNQASSETVHVIFDNPVRWPTPDPLFSSFVPVAVETDLYPADWTLMVRDEDGIVVRTILGTTAGPTIVTNWDGKDQNGVLVPELAAYELEMNVEATSGQSAMSTSSFSTTELDEFQLQGEEINRYGVTEQVYVKKVVTPAHYREVDLGVKLYNHKTGEYVVLVPPKTEFVPEDVSYFTNRIVVKPAKPTGAMLESSSNFAMMTSSATSAAVQIAVWREINTPSRRIVLSRQSYLGEHISNPTFFNFKLGQWMQNVLREAIDNSTLANSRTVYGGGTYVMEEPGSYGSLLFALSDPNVTSLYYHGHSDGERIGYSEFLEDEGLSAAQLMNAFTNYTYPPFTNRIRARYEYSKVFNFVFMDSCLSANGRFPHAFGIPKDLQESQFQNKKRRAFIGWTTESRNRLFEDDTFDWVDAFFQAWFAGGSGTVSLGAAVDSANAAFPSIMDAGLQIYGTRALRWRD